jgi:hypothetical protein
LKSVVSSVMTSKHRAVLTKLKNKLKINCLTVALAALHYLQDMYTRLEQNTTWLV